MLNGLVQIRMPSDEFATYSLIFRGFTHEGSSKMFLNAAKFNIL